MDGISSDSATISTPQNYTGTNFFSLNKYIPERIAPCGLPSAIEKYSIKGRKILYIFGHKQFKDNYPEIRHGTDADVNALNACFEDRFGFECTLFMDRTKQEIFKILKEVKVNDNDCFAVAILTHGKLHSLHAQDQLYDENMIYAILSDNTSLKNVLKLVIIQACRDKNFNSFEEPDNLLSVPQDTVSVHSTYPTDPAFRDTIYGSYLIQILCRRLSIMSEPNDFLDEMIFVQRDVGLTTKGKQMVIVAHNLRKMFVIEPKKND